MAKKRFDFLSAKSKRTPSPIGRKRSATAEPSPDQAEVDEAFEAVTGHKRPKRENILDSIAESALHPGRNREKSPEMAQKEGKEMADEKTLPYKSTQKNGVITFSGPGWSVYVNKSAFAQVPTSIRVGIDDGQFNTDGASRSGGRQSSPEAAAKLEEKVRKQEERQAKAAERLQKQKEKLERMRTAAGQQTQEAAQ